MVKEVLERIYIIVVTSYVKVTKLEFDSLSNNFRVTQINFVKYYFGFTICE